MDVVDRMIETMRHAFGALGRGRAGWLEHGDIGVLVSPDAPERSIANCVIYRRGADLASAYDWMEEQYANVDAWTVWVPEDDNATASFLESRGHKLDATPSAMLLDLPGWQPPVAPADWKPGTVEELAQINEEAYPWHDGSMQRAILRAAYDDVEFRLYITPDGSCALGINDCGGDAGVFLVATRPEARGRGLAGSLLAAALVEARDRGCDISTLQATRLGEPVYARLGYRRFGALQMWEKRRA